MRQNLETVRPNTLLNLLDLFWKAIRAVSSTITLSKRTTPFLAW